MRLLSLQTVKVAGGSNTEALGLPWQAIQKAHLPNATDHGPADSDAGDRPEVTGSASTQPPRGREQQLAVPFAVGDNPAGGGR